MATEKQISYINSLIDDNRNVSYLASTDNDENKKDWIVKSLGMPVYWPTENDDDDDSFTVQHYTLDELMGMRAERVAEFASIDLTAIDGQQASKIIDSLKKMLGRR